MAIDIDTMYKYLKLQNKHTRGKKTFSPKIRYENIDIKNENKLQINIFLHYFLFPKVKSRNTN